MPQDLTSRLSVVASRIQTIIAAKKGDTSFFTPAIAEVYYGDQEKLPSVPAVCVEPVSLVREWPPTPTDMTKNTLEVAILIHYTTYVGGVENARLVADQLSEAIADLLNINHRHLRDVLGNDLVIYSAVIQNDSGYTYRNDTNYRTNRLLWRGLTKTSLRIAE